MSYLFLVSQKEPNKVSTNRKIETMKRLFQEP